jgi:exosortase/archaeosortase family protein
MGDYNIWLSSDDGSDHCWFATRLCRYEPCNIATGGHTRFQTWMTFLLPGLSFEVAPECSGIDSCLAFVIAAILASRPCLRSVPRTLVLIVLTILIAIFKNAVRIVVITSRSVYVNRAVIDGPLHHRGGPVFALLDIALFVPLLFAFWRSEAGGLGVRPDSQSSRSRDQAAMDAWHAHSWLR